MRRFFMSRLPSYARSCYNFIRSHNTRNVEVEADIDKYENFSRSEIACRCGCGTLRISKLLMDRIQIMRTLYGKPMHPTSGCRCPNHNRNEGGSPKSFHLSSAVHLCKAIDIGYANNRELFFLVMLAVLVGFRRILIYPKLNFVHLDVGDRDQDILVIM
jgi:zinc D-Ala-D-Ala carboxypeptidase